MRPALACATVAAVLALAGCDREEPPRTTAVGPTPDAVASTLARPEAASARPEATSARPDEDAVTAPSPPPAATGGGPSCPTEEAIESVTWGEAEGGRSLAVVPAAGLRACAGPLVSWAAGPPGWAEVLGAAGAEADTAAMQQQYACHLRFARAKDVWRLEPWRPEVSDRELLAHRCNPTEP